MTPAEDKKDKKEKKPEPGEVDLKDVPAKVIEAAERILPKATWLSAIKVEEGEGKEKKTAYELDGTDGKERNVTLLVTDAGKVVEEETVLKKATNVPEKALAAVVKRWPNFTPVETHRIRQGENLRQDPKDGDHLYDMRGTVGKKVEREFHVQVTADGDILEYTAEVPLDKVPDEVVAALKKARPKFDIGAAFKLVEGKEVIGYHFEGAGPTGQHKTISVSPDGKQVELVSVDD